MDEGEDIEFEIGEYKQLWWNVKTGEVVYLGRISKRNPFYCDFDAKWTTLTPHSKSVCVQTFMKHHSQKNFFSGGNYGFYYDHSVHPTIQSWGYDGIDAFNWSCHCDEDSQHSDESNLYLQKCDDWIGFLQSFEHGNEFDSITKPYGFHTYIMLHQLGGKLKEDYFAAVKIARRNHYTIADQQMWDDMVKALSELGKDCHNAHYVCPEDFRHAHDHWMDKLQAERDKQRAMDMLKQAEEYATAYAERISKYLDIRLQNNNFDIFVCPSVEAMQQEGAAMHHCVFSMGYYKPNKKCLILLVRDKQGKRIATTELSTYTWDIVQTRGACNKVPEYQGKPCLDEINELIRRNVKYFKNPDKWATRTAKVVKLNPSVESVPTPSVALAA
ncbi:MAG: PcfJ domain-containing protein [Bacteroidales bacterium]|nr:PcfJ domain-containing protein [Bacteroidales bacterium]